MTIKAITHRTTRQRYLSINGGYMPIGIASMCADHRISGFEIKCTECRTKYPVRVLNEGGYCDSCVEASIEE